MVFQGKCEGNKIMCSYKLAGIGNTSGMCFRKEILVIIHEVQET